MFLTIIPKSNEKQEEPNSNEMKAFKYFLLQSCWQEGGGSMSIGQLLRFGWGFNKTCLTASSYKQCDQMLGKKVAQLHRNVTQTFAISVFT